MPKSNRVTPLADGSIFTGRQASELGLVDTLGGFEDAIRYAANMAGIKGEPRIIKEVKQKSGIFDLIGSTLGGVREIASGDIGGPRVMYLY
ncbi:MAG: S49 family peptidase [candidate division Zixibacteria bacterium]|nr:S49 family peptidase [candidate division Zixibacteria bacterium]